MQTPAQHEARASSVTFASVDDAYFKKRGLRRQAGIWSLWALGVGAVISGHFSGWNLGLANGGWGGMVSAAGIMAVMVLCLSFCIAGMSAALPFGQRVLFLCPRGAWPVLGLCLGPVRADRICADPRGDLLLYR